MDENTMEGRIVRFNDKMYDIKTPNKSFLKVALDLKRAGVEDWYFLLEIRDPTLIEFDPHQLDETGKSALTKDQIIRVIYECTNNIWYYLREICCIKDADMIRSVFYQTNRENIAQTLCMFHGIDSWLSLQHQ